jgi:hypothetical protein
MYTQDDWQTALEAAQDNDFCPIDSRERHSELAAFIAEQYEHETVGRDETVLQAAIDAAARQFITWGSEEFTEILNSYIDERPGNVPATHPGYIHIYDENNGTTYQFNRIRP